MESGQPSAERVFRLRNPSEPVDAQTILDEIQRGSRIDVLGAKVEGPLVLDDLTIASRVALIKCTLDEVSAKNAEFNKAVSFEGSTFSKGLSLLGATIGGVLNLDDVRVAEELWLLNCRVRSGLPAARMRIKGRVVAAELSVGASINFSGSIFEDEVDLSNCTIALGLILAGKLTSSDEPNAEQQKRVTFCSTLYADGARMRYIEGSGTRFWSDVSFSSIIVDSDAKFDGSRFYGNAFFDSARIEDLLNLSNCVFFGALSLVKVRSRDLLAWRTRFRSPVTAQDVATGLVFNCQQATFRSDFLLNGLSSGDLNFKLAIIKGNALLLNVRLNDRLLMQGCYIKGTLKFENLTVSANASLDGIQCEGGASADSISVLGRMSFDPASEIATPTRRSRDARPVLKGGTFPAVFEQGIRLSDASVGRSFSMVSAQSEETQPVNLIGVRVAGDASLNEMRAGLVDLSGSTIGGRLLAERADVSRLKLVNVSIEQDATLSELRTKEIDLYGTTIGGSLDLGKAHVGSLQAQFVTVKRDVPGVGASFENVDVAGGAVFGTIDFTELGRAPAKLCLKSGTFGAIFLTPTLKAGPTERNRLASTWIDLSDSAYAYIRCDPCLLMSRFVDPSNRQPYLVLEQTLRKRGFELEADRTYAAGRKQSRRPMRFKQPWFLDVFSQAVTGYGQNVFRTAVIMVGIVVLGAAYLFIADGSVRFAPQASKADTKLSDTGAKADAAPICHTKPPELDEDFWLSFKTFVPAPFPDSSWAVTDDCDVRIFNHKLPATISIVVIGILKVLGLILIPIYLAMVAGLFRPSARA